MDVAAARLTIARLPGLLRRLGDWWLKEFLSLFPERVAEFLAGRGQTMLAIAIGEGGVATLELLGRDFEPIRSVPVSRPERTAGELETFLRAHSLERKAVQIGLRLPARMVFSRQLFVPSEAAHAIDSIVAQDLARKTPFRAEDVCTDYAIVERIGGSRMRVSQWVARRDDVRNAVAPLKMPFEQLAFITFGDANASEPRPIIRLHRAADAGSAWSRKAMLAACCAGALLTAAACGLKYWSQQTALDRLDAEIATMSKKAQQVRGLVDQLQEKKVALLRVRIQRNDVPRLIDIWHEVTRILPSHSWLTEFKVAEVAGGREMQINLSGLSSAAPSLVGIVDRSPMFVDAALSAPVALDAAEGRERFALQAKVRRPDLVKGETR
jgi:general secretion pathway protein L